MNIRHPVPPEALDKHIAILGKTGSGMSNLAKTIAEDLLARAELTLILDEAHLSMPHAGNNLVSLGCGVGLRIVLVSQRPAKLQLRRGRLIAEPGEAASSGTRDIQPIESDMWPKRVRGRRHTVQPRPLKEHW